MKEGATMSAETEELKTLVEKHTVKYESWPHRDMYDGHLVDACEERCLVEMESKLNALGVSGRRSVEPNGRSRSHV